MTMKALMVECYARNKRYRYSDILKALNVSVHETEDKTQEYSYYLIVINFENSTVNVTSFKRNEEKLASEEYTDIESHLQDGKNAAVLVSVSKVDELRKAYPSYFLDTKEFTGNVDKICQNCLDWNLLSN